MTTQDGASHRVGTSDVQIASPRRADPMANALLLRRIGVLRPRQSVLGGLLYRLYGSTPRRFVRRSALSMALRLEGGEFVSLTARRILARYHGVEIGMFTHGCFSPGQLDRRTRVGRYCSIAPSARRFSRNHPMNLRSTHGIFFNENLQPGGRSIVGRNPMTIGNDVWIGHNAIILPSVTSIGDGAVIGAGAVVNKNIPAYAIVTGNPCRLARYRFSESVRRSLQESRWWERSLEDLVQELDDFQRPLEAQAWMQ